MAEKIRAGRNRTIILSEEDKIRLREKLLTPIDSNIKSENNRLLNYSDKTIHSDLLTTLPLLPDEFADLIIIDPPYNLTKDFNGNKFSARSQDAYLEYLESWFPQVCQKLKPTGSLYMCGDWKCTSALQTIMD